MRIENRWRDHATTTGMGRRVGLALQAGMGLLFLTNAAAKLAGAQDAARDHLALAPWFWALAGLAEVAGGAGLLAGLRVPRLATAAGLGLAALMAGALGAHLRAGDPPAALVAPVVFLTLALALAARGAGAADTTR